MISFAFPWPFKELNPNARCHWAKKAKAAKQYRNACHLIALAEGARHLITWEGIIHVWIEFVPPDRRSRDDDNLIASFKPARDGLADALGVNDSRFRVHPWINDSEIGGMVRVKITQELSNE